MGKAAPIIVQHLGEVQVSSNLQMWKWIRLSPFGHFSCQLQLISSSATVCNCNETNEAENVDFSVNPEFRK